MTCTKISVYISLKMNIRLQKTFNYTCIPFQGIFFYMYINSIELPKIPSDIFVVFLLEECFIQLHKV